MFGHRQLNAPTAAAFAALSVAALSTWDGLSESQPSHSIIVAQENADEKLLKAQLKKAKVEEAKAAKEAKAKAKEAKAEEIKAKEAKVKEAKEAKAKAAKAKEATAVDVDDVIPGKNKKGCPAGQTQAPSRGRGGDAGGCI
jgi:membrane protein involved in colicin uptake